MSDHGPSLPSSGVGASGQFIISARVGAGGTMFVPGLTSGAEGVLAVDELVAARSILANI